MAHEALLGILYTELNVGMGLIDPTFALVKRSRFSQTIARHVMACPCVAGFVEEECYLVDPASSHMLVSKIKPCMCKYEQIQTVKLRMAH